jgi:hypothetical protein
MALLFTFDPALRLIIEPGYRRFFSSAELAQTAQPADASSVRQLWCEPAYGTIMLKPLQLQPDFLNHAAQLSSGCCLRLSLDYVVEAADIAATTIFEDQVGNPSNPWIFHTPATPDVLGPSIPPVGPMPFHTLDGLAGSSESGSGTVFATPPGAAEPHRPPGDIVIPGSVDIDLRLLASTQNRMPANQGLFFRWYYPDPKATPHQTIYAFAFGQYFLYCRPAQLEIWRDVSPSGDRSAWNKEWAVDLFSPGAPERNVFNPNFAYGSNTLYEPPGEDRSLMVIPFRRQRLLLIANTGKWAVITVFNNPQIQAGGADWKITREDTVEIWALTGVPGRFQIQKVKYAPGPATLNMPDIKTEYTPVDPPAILLKEDVHYDEQIVVTGPTFPKPYTFPTSPTANDCPPPTQDGTGLSRTYGLTLAFSSTADQVFTPQFYGLEVLAQPTFMDNPATPMVVQDIFDDADSQLMSAEISQGTTPGDGHMTAHIQDRNTHPLSPYYFRSEAPVTLELDGQPLFFGYTERIEVSPLRQTGAPRQMTVRAVDKWLLLETAYLRDQIDHQTEGHISVVNDIIRQAGYDTASQPPEFPAGWDGALASVYNTPLGTPVQIADNLEGSQLLGWKPQILDTAATYLRRIQEFFSGWLMGFRMSGRFYYLPYNYFQEATVQFFAHENMGVSTGLMPSAAAGLNLNVSAGTGFVMGAAVSPGLQVITVPNNTITMIYLDAAGVAHAGTPPDGSLGLGAVEAAGGSITDVNTAPSSGRQLMTSPVYRAPVEHRTIEPSGNVVQVVTKYQIDLTSNHSGIFVDWASVRNPLAPNYLGRYKWFKYELAGAFTCPQLNAMAYIVFKNARRRRKRISIRADFVPTLEIGHVATVQGYGDYRVIQISGTLVKSNWETCTYTLESTERGY